MNMQDYLDQSGRTAAPPQERLELFDGDNRAMMRQCIDMVTIGGMADIMKRGMFYGTDVAKLKDRAVKSTEMQTDLYKQVDAKPEQFTFTPYDLDMLHGVFGVFSEAGEILEEMMKTKLEGREIDHVNIIEEIGDIMWYLALVLRVNDGSFEDAAERNLNKLKARYPEQFTQEKAENRDLDAERSTLEA